MAPPSPICEQPRKCQSWVGLIILNLDIVSINKILVTKFVTVKVSQNLNLMQSFSIQRNQQLIRYVFSKVMGCLEQNIWKQIDQKRPLNTKQMNWVQNIQTDMRKIYLLNFKSYSLFYLLNFKPYWPSSMQLVSNNSWFIWFKQAFNDKVVIARCLVQYWQMFSSFPIFCYCFTCLKAHKISCKIWETWKIFPLLHSAPCDNTTYY